MSSGIVNGNTANLAIKGAILLIFALIIAISVIVISGNPIPEVFTAVITLLIGFLIGTRTITDSVKESVVKKNDVERNT